MQIVFEQFVYQEYFSLFSLIYFSLFSLIYFSLFSLIYLMDRFSVGIHLDRIKYR